MQYWVFGPYQQSAPSSLPGTKSFVSCMLSIVPEARSKGHCRSIWSLAARLRRSRNWGQFGLTRERRPAIRRLICRGCAMFLRFDVRNFLQAKSYVARAATLKGTEVGVRRRVWLFWRMTVTLMRLSRIIVFAGDGCHSSHLFKAT